MGGITQMMTRYMTRSMTRSKERREIAILMGRYPELDTHILFDGKTSFTWDTRGLQEIHNNPQTLRGVLLHIGYNDGILPLESDDVVLPELDEDVKELMLDIPLSEIDILVKIHDY